MPYVYLCSTIIQTKENRIIIIYDVMKYIHRGHNQERKGIKSDREEGIKKDREGK